MYGKQVQLLKNPSRVNSQVHWQQAVAPRVAPSTVYFRGLPYVPAPNVPTLTGATTTAPFICSGSKIIAFCGPWHFLAEGGLSCCLDKPPRRFFRPHHVCIEAGLRSRWHGRCSRPYKLSACRLESGLFTQTFPGGADDRQNPCLLWVFSSTFSKASPIKHPRSSSPGKAFNRLFPEALVTWPSTTVLLQDA